MTYLWASATHIGLHRELNEDSSWPTTPGSGKGPVVAAVADGMGGHAGGEVASRLALQAAIARKGNAAQRVAAANAAVIDGIVVEPRMAGMGTTLTLGIFRSNRILEIGHVGDSRAYLLRDGDLTRLTRDHTLVAELLAEGRISDEEARDHPQRNRLTRAIGTTEQITIDTAKKELSGGDRILLCSDGLTSEVTDDRIAPLLGRGSPEEAAWALVEAANSAGGHDNVTVVVVDCLP